MKVIEYQFNEYIKKVEFIVQRYEQKGYELIEFQYHLNNLKHVGAKMILQMKTRSKNIFTIYYFYDDGIYPRFKNAVSKELNELDILFCGL